MTTEIPEEVARRVLAAKASSQVIEYLRGSPDKEYPEVLWDIFGLSETGEIAVLARVQGFYVGKAAVSGLLVPPMHDRVFGIDVDDQMLANELSETLWADCSARLIEAALRQRGKL